LCPQDATVKQPCEKAVKEFKDKVAVIAGAASGMGRAMANRCAPEGIRVVLADIEEPALAQTETEMKTGHGRLVRRT